MVGRYVYCVNTELINNLKEKYFSIVCLFLLLSMNSYKRMYDLWIRANIDPKPNRITCVFELNIGFVYNFRNAIERGS